MLTGLTRPIRQWIDTLDGTRDLAHVLREAVAAGLDEPSARSLLDQLIEQGVLHDASAPPLALPLAELDRLRPDLEALDLASSTPDGGRETMRRRREAHVRVYGAGRVGAQVVALLAAAGVGTIRVIDPEPTRPEDLAPGGLTWSELGLSRQDGTVALARRATTPPPPEQPDGRTPGSPSAPPSANARTTYAKPGPSSRSDSSANGHHPPTTPGPTATSGNDRQGPTPEAKPRRPLTTNSGMNRQNPTTDAKPGRPPTTEDATNRLSPITDAEPGRASTTNGATNRQTPTTRAKPSSARSPNRGGNRQSTMTDAEPGCASSFTRGADRRAPTVDVQAGGPYLSDKTHRPDLVILTPVRPLDRVLVNELIALGIPHLLVAAFEGHGCVGPLVLPGQTACLHCLDLARRDRDPAWPIVTARLGGYPPGEIACDAVLASLVAAAATGHALAHLEGREAVVTNGTMDVFPDWHWERRSWVMHPQCRCTRNNPHPRTMVMSATCD
jgi:hypothetical protein